MKVAIEKVDHFDLGDLNVSMSLTDIGIMEFCLKVSSMIYRGTVDGKVICIWGLVPSSLLSDRAYLWLYTTKEVEEHQFIFVRHSQRMIEEMLKQFDIIVGHAHIDAPRSIRWLKWLGATFSEPDGKRIPFVIRKKNGSN